MQSKRLMAFLLLGDIVVIAIVTIIGFASHGTLASAGLRILATFLPMLVAWIAVAPFFGLYDLHRILDSRYIWRPPYAAIIVSPLAAWIRGIILGSPVLPIFVAVLGAVSALALLLWRVLFLLSVKRESS